MTVMLEEVLAARCRRRDPEALNAVAAQFGPRIYRWAFARTGDAEIAADIVQDTLTRFLQTIDRFEGRCSLLTWLYTISHNLIANGRRNGAVENRSRNRRASPAEGSQDPGVEGALDLVRGLPEELRSVVILHYVEGLSLGEISDVLGLPASTLKWRLFEGRSRLRQRLGRGEHP